MSSWPLTLAYQQNLKDTVLETVDDFWDECTIDAISFQRSQIIIIIIHCSHHVFSLAKSLQLILGNSATYRLFTNLYLYRLVNNL